MVDNLQQSRPLVAASTLRLIRSGQFSRKRSLGPETTQAIVEGSLQAERERQESKAALDLQARLDLERTEEQERQFDEQLAESRRQFDLQQEAQEEALESSTTDALIGAAGSILGSYFGGK